MNVARTNELIRGTLTVMSFKRGPAGSLVGSN